MPRRNSRPAVERVVYENLGSAYRPTRNPELEAERAHERRQRAEEAKARSARRRLQWGSCILADCDRTVIPDPDETAEYPICWEHSVEIWQMVQRRRHLPTVIGLSAELSAAHDQKVQAKIEADLAEERAAFLAQRNGDIYFVRLNGLIKVGWSRDLAKRLRAYGPDVEILCHYPGTRDDETNLHRQLTPYRAKGREWYEDCKLLHDLAQQAIDQHGPPRVVAEWTKPKQIIKPRKRAS